MTTRVSASSSSVSVAAGVAGLSSTRIDSMDDKTHDKTDHDDRKKYNEAFFETWLENNTTKLQQSGVLPQLDEAPSKSFTCACQCVQDSQALLQAAINKRDDIAKQKPIDQKALDKANQAVKDATKALTEAQDSAYQSSLPLLDEWKTKAGALPEPTRQLLLVTQVLQQATPKGLATYCLDATKTDDQVKVLLQLLLDERQFGLLERMVLAGGAKNGKYGQALEIYTKLKAHVTLQKTTTIPQSNTTDQQQQYELLDRLALAVALELAQPLLEFHQDKTFVDPIQRYLHYEQAYLFGELDPVFATEFGVWELRMIINSVAPNDQLGWGRQMLMNYRPDILQYDDKWRYCRIVRTDVYYTGQPNWPHEPLDFPQILSGGGECGPRAWMGRFICRAFGIPVWGIKQPGHAAMARWTLKEGWQVCLGAEIEYAWWDDMGGTYFALEAASRKICAAGNPATPNSTFGKQVMMMDWIADLRKEPTGQIKRWCLEDPKAFWRTLAVMQRKLLQKSSPPSTDATDCQHRFIPKLERLLTRNNTELAENIVTMDGGTIVIPAANMDPPAKPNSNVIVMDSFLGGKQLFLDKDGQVEYTLTDVPSGKYNLVFKFVTVHDDKVKPPFLVTIDSTASAYAKATKVRDCQVDGFGVDDDHDLCAVYSVPLPYTKGMWEETKPVVVELPTSSSSGKTSCTISLSREATAHGMALKQLKLIPSK